MSLEAKKLSIIEQVLALEEEPVLDAILATISSASDDIQHLKEGEAIYKERKESKT